MIRVLLLICIFCASNYTFGQRQSFDSTGVFTGKPDIAPSHKSGLNAWTKFLASHLRNAHLGTNDSIPEGPYTITVSFVIDENGNLSDFKAIHDPGYGISEQAIKLIKAGPGYTPAILKGKPVKYRYTESINYEMASS